jgi:hypothetical protein
VARRIVLALVVVGGAIAVFAGGPAGSVAGGWRLVEQFYNDGSRNFASVAPAYTMVLRDSTGGRLAGAVSHDGWSSDWPVWPTPDGPAALTEVVVRRLADGGVEAEYRVAPAPGDDTFLKVRETCTLESIDRLRCDVRVRFERGGQEAGGFTWRRLFARESGS